MEQVKEMWNLVFGWIGNGKKMIMGGIFLLAGLIGQSFSDKTLTQIPFVLMVMGVLSFVNALFSKITKNNINLFLFLFANILVTEIAIALASAELLEGAALFGAEVLCVIVLWALHTWLLKAEDKIKRVVLAFAATCTSIVAVLLAFALPIMLEIWRERH